MTVSVREMRLEEVDLVIFTSSRPCNASVDTERRASASQRARPWLRVRQISQMLQADIVLGTLEQTEPVVHVAVQDGQKYRNAVLVPNPRWAM